MSPDSFPSRRESRRSRRISIKPVLAPCCLVPNCDAHNVSDSSYANFSGTSMATSHIAGAMALLWSAIPSLRHQLTASRDALNNSAVHISVDSMWSGRRSKQRLWLGVGSTSSLPWETAHRRRRPLLLRPPRQRPARLQQHLQRPRRNRREHRGRTNSKAATDAPAQALDLSLPGIPAIGHWFG